MPGFSIESELPVDVGRLSRELFSMAGVNRELSPLVRMSAPADWRERPLGEWPRGVFLFRSVIALFGLVPIDLHHFRLMEGDGSGFEERSRSILNREWHHRRMLSPCAPGARVRDVVEYRSRLGPLGWLLWPVYRGVFAWRHRRLRSRYGTIGRRPRERPRAR